MFIIFTVSFSNPKWIVVSKSEVSMFKTENVNVIVNRFSFSFWMLNVNLSLINYSLSFGDLRSKCFFFWLLHGNIKKTFFLLETQKNIFFFIEVILMIDQKKLKTIVSIWMYHKTIKILFPTKKKKQQTFLASLLTRFP